MTTSRIIAVSVGLGAANWFLDAYIDWRFYYNAPYLDLLIRDVPFNEILIRLGAFVLIVMFGAVMAGVMAGRKRAETALQKAKDELETKVEERTSELQRSEHHLRLLSSQLMAAQEAERRRVSRELHDELGQALTVLKLRLKALEERLPGDGAEVLREYDEIVRYVDRIIGEARRISWDLCPSVLEDLGLTAALKWLISEFERNDGLKITLGISGFGDKGIDRMFSDSARSLVYRIVQEALTNITKHAGATAARVTMSLADETACLSIEDNGAGFDADARVTETGNEGTLGLSAMSERARMLGGSIEVRSSKGKGTRIIVNIPIEKGAGAS